MRVPVFERKNMLRKTISQDQTVVIIITGAPLHIWGVKHHYYPVLERFWVVEGELWVCAHSGEEWRLQWLLGNQSTKHSLVEAEGFEIKATCFTLQLGKIFNMDDRCNVCMHASKDSLSLFSRSSDMISVQTLLLATSEVAVTVQPFQAKIMSETACYDKFDQDMMLLSYWSLNSYVQCEFCHSKRKNMLCNTWVVSSSRWTKGSKAEGDDRKNWGREKGAGMQPMVRAMHCKGASLYGAVM